MRAALLPVLAAIACGGTKSEAPASAASTDAALDTSRPDVALEAALDAASDAREDAEPPPSDAYFGPESLAATGLYGDFAAKTIAADVFHYDVRYPVWTDGLENDRWVFIPKGTTIDTSDADHWLVPVGAKLWKEFRKGGHRIETRYLERRASEWTYVSYVWNDAQTDAIATPAGKTGAYGTWDAPDRETCWACHAGVKEYAIGLSTFQLSRADGTGPLAELTAKGWLSKPVAQKEPPGSGVVKDTLGYLHGNCGHCHNGDGIWKTAAPLRNRLLVSDTTPESTGSYVTTIGKTPWHMGPGDVSVIVVPGAPSKSQLWVRMGLRDFWAMPMHDTHVVDDAGVALVGSWIDGLP